MEGKPHVEGMCGFGVGDLVLHVASRSNFMANRFGSKMIDASIST